MNMRLTIEEATSVLRSNYGMESKGERITTTIVTEWMEQGLKKSSGNGENRTIDILDLEEFVEESKWKGTAFEKGIDEQTKIERLLDELFKLKAENERLQKENYEYALKLGIGDFSKKAWSPAIYGKIRWRTFHLTFGGFLS